MFRRSAVSTLFIPPSARGFVDQVTGDFRFRVCWLHVALLAGGDASLLLNSMGEWLCLRWIKPSEIRCPDPGGRSFDLAQGGNGESA